MPELSWLAAVARLRAARESRRARHPGDRARARAARGRREDGGRARTRRWGSIGGGNVEAVAIDRARELLADPDAGADLLTVAAVGQGALPARRAVLRRRGQRAARAAAGRPGGRDLRGRARGHGAGPHPRPPRHRAAPDRHPSRAARPTRGSPCWPTRWRKCTCIGCRCCPRSCSASCRPARTC